MVALLALSAIYVGLRRHDLVDRAVPGLAPAVHGDRRPGGGPGRQAGARPPGAGRARRRRVPGARRSSPCRSRSSSSRAGVVGWALGPLAPGLPEQRKRTHGRADGAAPLIPDDALHHARRSRRRVASDPRRRARRSGSCRSPAVALARRTATASSSTRACSSPGTAVVTFGGAYAVLVVRRPAGGRGLRLAGARRDGPRAGAGGDDAGTADHGRPVRGVPRRLPRPGLARPVGGGRAGARCSRLGDLRARASCSSSSARRTSSGCATTDALGRADRHHRGRGRA